MTNNELEINLEEENNKKINLTIEPNDFLGFELEMEEKIKEMNNLFTSLKIPDIIKDLPEFNGTQHTLNEFISNVLVDEIIEHCTDLLGKDNTPKTFLRAIRNKITGKANIALISYGTTINWSEIRQNLIAHYSDKRTETILIRDLHRIFQNIDTVEQYYSKIIQIQSAIINIVRLNKQDSAIKEKLYREMCLSQFLANLKEPMGSTIRSRDPQSISIAFEMCITEQNMYYVKQKVLPPPIRQNWSPRITNPNFKPYPFKSQFQFNPQSQQNLQYYQNWSGNNSQTPFYKPLVPAIKNEKQELPIIQEIKPTNRNNNRNPRLNNIQINEETENDQLENPDLNTHYEYIQNFEQIEPQETTDEQNIELSEFFQDEASETQ